MKHPSMDRAISKFFLHLHPKKIEPKAILFTRTFGLGGIAALLFVILFITGMLLRFAYVPSGVGAYDSIVRLQDELIFGRMLRNFHYWSAMLLVVVSFLHLVRVFYSQAIYFQRRKNWLYGLLLMFLVVSSNFTGYLLPWDQLSFWAVTIMTNMLSYIPFFGNSLANLVRGSKVVDEQTLLRFYNFHTGVLPLLMVFFMSIHFWLVRKARGVTIPSSEKAEKVDTSPHLVYKEVLAALIVVLVLLLFSFFVNAPLLDKAKPLVSPNHSKAPWYFMGFQELLMHIHPAFASFLLPLFVILFFIIIPYVPYHQINEGVWFYSEKGKKITFISAIFTTVFTLLLILIDDLLLDIGGWFSGLPVIFTEGVLPVLCYFVPIGGFIFYVRKKLKADRMELVISSVTIILVAYVVMMLVGSLLRGEGMQLIF
ncbi:cytochrome b N-terminal domain-containing protein [Sunxiuqinia indica]|uniref:cytochrome b N-terminal domain-containing protein n=1 Tax=Sunxiuqinia indica TaxID=2692584 RepID=UPI00135A8BB6|nr:cytochrome b N-terminal domain-containing protein [Sunxiuqinia indica]